MIKRRKLWFLAPAVLLCFLIAACDSAFTPPIAQPSLPIIEATGAGLEGGVVTVFGQVRREAEGETVAGIVVEMENVHEDLRQEVSVAEDGLFELNISVADAALILVQATDPETGQESNILETVVSAAQASEASDDPAESIAIVFTDASASDYDGDGVADSDDLFPIDPSQS